MLYVGNSETFKDSVTQVLGLYQALWDQSLEEGRYRQWSDINARRRVFRDKTPCLNCNKVEAWEVFKQGSSNIKSAFSKDHLASREENAWAGIGANWGQGEALTVAGEWRRGFQRSLLQKLSSEDLRHSQPIYGCLFFNRCPKPPQFSIVAPVYVIC